MAVPFSFDQTAHRRALHSQLRDRSDGSVERKHQNISTVLLEMGNPFIVGYKPLSNHQRSLVEAVTDCLNAHPNLHRLFKQDAQFEPSVPSVEDFLAALGNPPEHNENRPQRAAEPGAIYNPAGANYLEMEACSQSLGEAGEQFVINYEHARLMHLGKESLAERIKQVSARASALLPVSTFACRKRTDRTASSKPKRPRTARARRFSSRPMN